MIEWNEREAYHRLYVGLSHERGLRQPCSKGSTVTTLAVRRLLS